MNLDIIESQYRAMNTLEKNHADNIEIAMQAQHQKILIESSLDWYLKNVLKFNNLKARVRKKMLLADWNK